jgi:hypothetical protein
MVPFAIREATPADTEAVRALLIAAFGQPASSSNCAGPAPACSRVEVYAAIE